MEAIRINALGLHNQLPQTQGLIKEETLISQSGGPDV